MKFSTDELKAIAADALKGRSPKTFLTEGARQIASWLGTSDRWTDFGPYWPIMQRIIDTYGDGSAAGWNSGEPAPDYLEHYSTGDDVLDWAAALTYLNRDGSYHTSGQPHSIELTDGSMALYTPGVGLLETDD